MSAEGKWTAGLSAMVAVDAARMKAGMDAAIEALFIDNPDLTIRPDGEVWLSGGVTPQTAGCLIDVQHLVGMVITSADTAASALVADMAEALREAEAALALTLQHGRIDDSESRMNAVCAALTRARAALAKGGAT